MAPPASTADDDARRGVRFALFGILAIPLTVLLIGAAPQVSRVTLFVVGLASIAALSLIGGNLARRALAGGTELRGLAVAGAIVGLWLGITAAVMCFWTLVGVVI